MSAESGGISNLRLLTLSGNTWKNVNGEKMTSRRTARYGTLLSIVLAMFLTMTLAACTDDGDPGGEGTPGSLFERATEREATPEAGSSGTETPTGSQSLFGRATPGPTGEGESSANGPTPEPTVELGPCSPRAATLPRPTETSAETDREALVAIFEATDGPSWDESGLWDSLRSISDWPGITTDEEGRVVKLNLNNNQLSGELPPELGNLVKLEFLRLEKVALSGALLAELGNLVNLRELHLSENALSGAIPPELGNLVNLTTLNLDNNQLCGELPPELGNLVALKLSNNELSGELPPELGNIGSQVY